MLFGNGTKHALCSPVERLLPQMEEPAHSAAQSHSCVQNSNGQSSNAQTAFDASGMRSCAPVWCAHLAGSMFSTCPVNACRNLPQLDFAPWPERNKSHELG